MRLLRSATAIAGFAAGTLTASGQTPPVGVPRPLPTAGADARTALLMRRLAALSADSMEGRLAGSPGGRRARGWIERELRSIGVTPVAANFEVPFRLPPRAGADTLGANIVGRIRGRNPALPVIVVSAHYDHLGTRAGKVYNGADDDASGCVALLAIAEGLMQSPIEHDVLLVFFDAEESGLRGAHAFVASPPVPLSQIAIDINLDMVSRQDGGAIWVAGLSHYPFLKAMVDPVAARATVQVRTGHDTKSIKPDDDWTESSDHGAFHDKGIPFLYLGVEDHVDYHKPGDDAEKVQPAFFSGVVDFADALLRSVDQAFLKIPSR